MATVIGSGAKFGRNCKTLLSKTKYPSSIEAPRRQFIWKAYRRCFPPYYEPPWCYRCSVEAPRFHVFLAEINHAIFWSACIFGILTEPHHIIPGLYPDIDVTKLTDEQLHIPPLEDF